MRKKIEKNTYLNNLKVLINLIEKKMRVKKLHFMLEIDGSAIEVLFLTRFQDNFGGFDKERISLNY